MRRMSLRRTAAAPFMDFLCATCPDVPGATTALEDHANDLYNRRMRGLRLTTFPGFGSDASNYHLSGASIAPAREKGELYHV